jgi:hypothetical protein
MHPFLVTAMADRMAVTIIVEYTSVLTGAAPGWSLLDRFG